MDLHEDARSQQDDLARLRQELHREPEIGLDLPRTQERVLRELDGLGLEISTGTDTTSVTAVLRGEGSARDSAQPRTVLLRADMDALPVQEATGLDFAATNGAMHACGHDLHTTSLVGAARLLHTHRDRINGDVVLMFQPGEEGWDGAGVMLKEGVLDAAGRRADAAYGLHVFSSMLPSGQFASRPGTLMSASHKLLVTVHGEGGHGSMPHRAKDPISAAAAMITALQTMITRRLDIFDPAVLTVGVIRGGTKRNVIPATAEFEATVRCFSDDTAALLDTTIRETIDGVARANGVTADVVFENEYPVTVTDVDETAFGAEVVRETIGEQYYTDLPNPVAGSEDFSRVLAAVPGTFLGLGALMPGLEPHTAPNNHSPYADFDPSVLSRAATVYAELAVRRLDRFAEGASR
ncbi:MULTISPECIES: M20 metallopeptidase family protein [Amycolatopsis]|uniref:Amidohydrolase n=1 Tax=Amycolatopsis dendrobii TaxID=2760662 RepID=A0A7W3ZBH7_9PSEU|nr:MULTISPECIES: M20 family metallopeptidase [Amycolatopsis]MBB1155295.1 amidohydrolase [Amycolatopsis dendrobii]UKD54761.1 M20 family metallopeptidase [Amycolatopsis sp. FU40]